MFMYMYSTGNFTSKRYFVYNAKRCVRALHYYLNVLGSKPLPSFFFSCKLLALKKKYEFCVLICVCHFCINYSVTRDCEFIFVGLM